VDRSLTDVDERPTKVGRKFDESPTYVERVKLSRHCGDGGQRRYTAALRNAATMAGNTVARNIVAALASNALQLATFLRRYCSNTLDLVALLRWPATQHCYDNMLDLATLLRWPATRWTSQRCCDVPQRATTTFLFFVFFFTPDNLKREKEWEKERSFDTCSLVSRLHLSQLGWL
jgi:hypothetical protein